MHWLLMLLCAASLAAQDGEDLDEEELLEFDFKVYAVDRNPIEGLHYDLEGQAVPIEFKKKRRSDPYHYKGPKLVTFFKQDVNEEGEPVRVPIASVAMTPGNREPLFFFLPVTKPNENGPKYSVSVIDDSTRAFPYGSVMIFNASGAELAGKVGDRQLMLPYGPTEPMPMSRLRESRRDPWINFFFAAEVAEDEYELVFRNAILFRDDGRTILVLRPPRRPRSIKIYTYLLEEFEPMDDEQQQSPRTNDAG